MSNILFKTISFNKDDYSYSFVEGKTVNIVLNGVEVPVLFNSHEEAIEGLKELNDKLNGNTVKQPQVKSDLEKLVESIESGAVLKVLNSCNDKLRAVMDGVQETVKENLLEGAFKQITKKAENHIEDAINDIDAVLTHMFTKPYESEPKEDAPEEKPAERVKPTIITKVKRSFDVLDDVFGTNTVQTSTEEEKPEISDILIGDMTTVQLRREIETFVDSIISSERASAMFSSIVANFDEATAKQAIDAFKNLIYQVAIANPDKTLDEVLRENFQ